MGDSKLDGLKPISDSTILVVPYGMGGDDGDTTGAPLPVGQAVPNRTQLQRQPLTRTSSIAMPTETDASTGTTQPQQPQEQDGTGTGTVPRQPLPRQHRPQYADLTGVTLGGRYVLERRLGLGGMAVVYQGHDASLDREVAVKMMLPQFAEDESFSERFYVEAKSAAKLQSGNIVTVYDWGFDNATQSHYIVMELLTGTDLKHGIVAHAPFPCKMTAEIAMQVCSGLAAAHAHGIIHRDIKPQNIMVMSDRTVKIMDFGIARPSDVHLTSGSNVLGTAQYISPEQTRGLNVTPTSDIYSLGIVMYECVTGKLPFDGKDAVTVALKQVKEQPVPPSQVNPDVDPVMERIILKCMAKVPEDRFESAVALRDALSAYVQGKDVDIQPTASATIPMSQAIDSPDAASVAVRRNKGIDTTRRKRIAVVIAAIVAIAAIGIIAAFANGAFDGNANKNENVEQQVEKKDVPDIIGMSEADARSTIEDAGFKVGDVTQEWSDEVNDGDVISQTPTADDGQQDVGTSIDMVVSKGAEPPKTAVVPSLTNMSQQDATNKLSALGFTVSVTYGNSDTVENGFVMDQNPQSNTTLQIGSTVTITISKGADTVSVPSLDGMTQDAAQAALDAAGLTMGTISQSASDDIPKGQVATQSVAAGTMAKRGTAVNITLSTGKATVNVGALGLIGKTLAEAKNALNADGVSVSVSGSNDVSAIVQDVSPMTVEKGGTVTVVTVAPSNGNGNSNANANSNGNANDNGNAGDNATGNGTTQDATGQ